MSLKLEHEKLIQKFFDDFSIYAQRDVHVSHEGSAKDFLTNSQNCFTIHFGLVVDLKSSKIEYSTGVEKVLGYNTDEFCLDTFYTLIHPQDLPKVLECINKAYQHVADAKEREPLEVQLSITHRMKGANGKYMHIQHVIAILATDEDSNAIKTVTQCTDISQIPFKHVTANLKCPCDDFTLCFNNEADQLSHSIKKLLSKRELEIAKLLQQNKSSFEMGKILSISKHTVDKHRSNILKKTGVNNTQELHSLMSI